MLYLDVYLVNLIPDTINIDEYFKIGIKYIFLVIGLCLFYIFLGSPGTNVLGEVLSYPPRRRRRHRRCRRRPKQFQVKVFVY